MRPQHITAENLISLFGAGGFYPASMRPQHITAENGTRYPVGATRIRRASMRPQHITAENRTGSTRRTAGAPRFNEAAAYHCGKLELVVLHGRRRIGASMRPQHITAENGRARVPSPPTMARLQ